jgi:hypothetical protein
MGRHAKAKGPEFWDNAKDLRHGTVNGYSNLHCRCNYCREAWRQYHLVYMHTHPEQRERHSKWMSQYRGYPGNSEYRENPTMWTREPECTCGRPSDPHIVHRVGGTPCFILEDA